MLIKTCKSEVMPPSLSVKIVGWVVEVTMNDGCWLWMLVADSKCVHMLILDLLSESW